MSSSTKDTLTYIHTGAHYNFNNAMFSKNVNFLELEIRMYTADNEILNCNNDDARDYPE